MKKNKSLIIIISVIILILIFLIFVGTKNEKSFNQIQLYTSKNLITNTTQFEYYDTIIHVGLEKLGYEGIDMMVFPLSETAIQNFSSLGDLNAHIREKDGKYYLFILPSSRQQSILTISHELIHLTQYHTKKLIFSNGIVIWDGKQYILDQINYNVRPWEEEAFSKERELSDKISKILY